MVQVPKSQIGPKIDSGTTKSQNPKPLIGVGLELGPNLTLAEVPHENNTMTSTQDDLPTLARHREQMIPRQELQETLATLEKEGWFCWRLTDKPGLGAWLAYLRRVPSNHPPKGQTT